MATQSSSTVTAHRDDDGSTVTLTLRRAQCLDIAGKQELTHVFSALADDADARVVILRSEHPAALLVDVAELAHMTPAAALSYSRAGQRLMETLEALPVPIIAAVSGPALGGGCELVLGCDLAFCMTTWWTPLARLQVPAASAAQRSVSPGLVSRVRWGT